MLKRKRESGEMHPRAWEFLDLMNRKYIHDPVGFAEDVMNITLSDNQQKPALQALADPNGKRSVAVKSGHGTGKSFIEALTVIWFMVTRPNARVIMTAPSARQLYDTMMSEISSIYHKSILSDLRIFTFTKDRIRINCQELSSTWFVSAVSVSNPENFSGMHAEHILAIVDEGSGISADIFIRLEGVLTTEGSYMMTCCNPSFVSGYIYDIFHNDMYSQAYDLFTFNAEDSPNVEDSWIEMMRNKYGEDSNIYKVRVLGEFSPLDEQTVLRRDDVRRSIGRRLVRKGDQSITSIGVDVASGKGNDFTVISVRRGNEEIDRLSFKEELRYVKNRIIIMASKYIQTSECVVINIDVGGLGVQLGQDISDHYYYKDSIEVNEINFSNKAMDSRQFNSIATEMMFQLADQIDEISLLANVDTSTMLEEELGSRKYGYDSQNRFQIEKKKEWIKRFDRSPDISDAVCLAFYERRNFFSATETYFEKYQKERR